MSKEKKDRSEKMRNGQPMYVIAQPQETEDEIDLLEILEVFWKRKVFLLAWCFFITLAALVIALLMPRYYKAEATFYPSTQSDLSGLTSNGVFSISPMNAYKILIKNLESQSIRKKVFNNVYLKSLPKDKINDSVDLYQAFTKTLKVKLSEFDKKTVSAVTSTSISFEDKNRKIVAPVVNQLFDLATEETKNELINERALLTKNKIFLLEEKIALLRQNAKKDRENEIVRLETADNLKKEQIEKEIKILEEREKIAIKDQLTRLEESLAIAESMGIEDPLEHALETISKVNAASNSTSSSTINTSIIPQTTGLYALGSIALKARIKALKERKNFVAFATKIRNLQTQLKELENNPKIEQLRNRKNDDPFIPSLLGLEGQLIALQKSLRHQLFFTVVSAYSPAETPQKPVKSKKIYVLIAGMLLAIISGAGIVLGQHFLRNRFAPTDSSE